MASLRVLLEESHKDLHQWFLMHQECLLIHREKECMLAWQAFAEFLAQHLAFENATVIPGVQAMGVTLRWDFVVYTKEHEKLQAMVVDMQEMLDDYNRMQGRTKRLGLLSLLDRQQSLYHVMEHHEEREEKDLFTHLEALDASAINVWQKKEKELFAQFGPLKEQLKVLLHSV